MIAALNRSLGCQWHIPDVTPTTDPHVRVAVTTAPVAAFVHDMVEALSVPLAVELARMATAKWRTVAPHTWVTVCGPLKALANCHVS
jgi:hypothetical protein